MSSISSLWGRLTPPSYHYKDAPKLDAPDSTGLYGIELEIEDVHEDMVVKGFTATTDGSLRNSGLEFISAPMSYHNMVHGLNLFFSKNELSEDNYSDRTSIHIHANCLDISLSQLGSVLMVYQVFEELLFMFVGEDRNKNIFCTPLSECAVVFGMCERLHAGDHSVISGWPKYTALNLHPICEHGTVEFRHMAGTHDVAKIVRWLRLIGHIIAYAKAHTYEAIKTTLISLNTTSEYQQLLTAVFHEDSIILQQNGYQMMMESGVLNMKYSVLKKPLSPGFMLLDSNLWATIHEAPRFEQGLTDLLNDVRNPAGAWARDPPMAEEDTRAQVARPIRRPA
jgi:hypothetical protein